MNVLVGQILISPDGYPDTFNRIDNDAVYRQYTMPSVRQYALRHGFEYKVITDVTEDFFMPPAWKVASQRFRFLSEDFDWFVYLDADTYVSQSAENILSAVTQGFGASIEKTDGTWIRKFRLQRIGGYFNSGVMIMDRRSARLILRCIMEYVGYCSSADDPRMDVFEPLSEQSLLNYAVASSDIPFVNLPRNKWNYMVESEAHLLKNPSFSIAHFPWKYKELLHKLWKEGRKL
jgi:hypothetical protein